MEVVGLSQVTSRLWGDSETICFKRFVTSKSSLQLAKLCAADNRYFVANESVVDVVSMNFSEFLDSVSNNDSRRLYLRAPLFEGLKQDFVGGVEEIGAWYV